MLQDTLTSARRYEQIGPHTLYHLLGCQGHFNLVGCYQAKAFPPQVSLTFRCSQGCKEYSVSLTLWQGEEGGWQEKREGSNAPRQ